MLGGLPLLALHVGMLVERVMHRETLDATVVLRWVLSVALLVVLKRVAAGTPWFGSPMLGVAAVLIFALIHAPVVAPEPNVPLAATGIGFALALAVVDRLSTALAARPNLIFAAPSAAPAWSSLVSRETFRGRAPPISR